MLNQTFVHFRVGGQNAAPSEQIVVEKNAMPDFPSEPNFCAICMYIVGLIPCPYKLMDDAVALVCMGMDM